MVLTPWIKATESWICFLLISFSSLQGRETRRWLKTKSAQSSRKRLLLPTNRKLVYTSALSLSRLLASLMLFCRFLSRIFWSSFFSLQMQLHDMSSALAATSASCTDFVHSVEWGETVAPTFRTSPWASSAGLLGIHGPFPLTYRRPKK